MKILGVDHYTIRCRPDELAGLHDFYTSVLNLTSGCRPGFDFPGHWLYAGDRPVVHLAGLEANNMTPDAGTGGLDHISFSTTGLQSTRERLELQGVAYDEFAVPGMPLHQIFLRDPAGLKIELTFDVSGASAKSPA